MEILDGRKVKKEIMEELERKLKKERQLGLAVIQVGNDSASNTYVEQKRKMAEKLGYDYRHILLDENIREEEVLEEIESLNQNELIDGIIVQMPLPKHLNAKIIQNAVDYKKDVDGLTDLNMGRLVHNEECLVACTPAGIIELLNYYNIDVQGKHVVIVGRSDLVGKPLFNLMINNDATVTLTHSKTENLKEITKTADILVVSIGKKEFITREYVKEGAIVVDVGINWVDSKMYGDVDFEDVKDKASYITPVPGGVGQMTVAELGKNVYKAYTLRKTRK